MNSYRDKLSKGPEPPRQMILDRSSNKYYSALNREGLGILAVALGTPDVERTVSRELAAHFNVNRDKYDFVLDQKFNASHVGGSILHHNLDGSHTFHGATEALRKEYPNESEFHLNLHRLEHLARDFTTPSGINPFLDPVDFLKTRAFLEELGIHRSLANDLLNFNAAELAGAFVGAGALLLRIRTEKASTVAAQAARLSVTYFFAGNLLGLLVASAALLRLAASEETETEQVLMGASLGSGQLLLAATLLPTLPLSLSLVIGTAACAAGKLVLGGGVDLATEMENMFSVQFPHYRSYLKSL